MEENGKKLLKNKICEATKNNIKNTMSRKILNSKKI